MRKEDEIKRLHEITLRDDHGIYSIKVYPENIGNLDDVMNLLVRPVLLAAGYGEKSVDEYIME